VFRKARILAIFDDLDTVLLMIPLQMMIVGLKWQLVVVIILMAVLLWLAWKHLHKLNIPITWGWVMGYAAAITLVAEGLYLVSKVIDKSVVIHMEVLLPAFVLGCMIAKHKSARASEDPSGDEHHAWYLRRTEKNASRRPFRRRSWCSSGCPCRPSSASRPPRISSLRSMRPPSR
jgi:hypothetical protein